MDLILWRHADAIPVDENGEDARKLSAKGRKQSTQMAKWLDQRLPDSARILSGKLPRDMETADALAALSGRKRLVKPELGAGASVTHLLVAADWPQNRHPVVIVGHQPALGRLAALLLFGEEQDLTIRKGAIWWLTNRRRGDGAEERDAPPVVLRAVICPDFL